MLEIHVHVEGDSTRVDLQDRDAAFLVGWMDHNLPIESSWSKQRRIEHVWPVCGGEDDDPLVSGEAIHLRENLIQSLFTLVVSPE